MWLNCLSERQIAESVGVAQSTVGDWVEEKRQVTEFFQPPGCEHSDPKNPKHWGAVQHFDVWQFTNGGDGSYFGRMPPQIVANLLWHYTEPGDIVVDPFAGSSTTIEVKAMGGRVWASASGAGQTVVGTYAAANSCLCRFEKPPTA